MLFSTLCLLLISVQNRRLQGMRSMVTAFLLLLGSNTMLVLGPRVPAFFPHVLANLLLLVGLSFIHFSFPEVLQRARSQRLLSAALALFVFVGCMVFTYLDDSHAIRALVVSIVVAIQSAATAVILYRFAEPAVRYPARSTAVIFALLTAVQTHRIVWIAVHRVAPDEVPSSSVRWLVLLGYAVLAATIPLLYFWIMTIRLQGRLEQLAFTDSLTGLLNRRSIEHEGTIELSRIPRTQDSPPLSLILFDLDFFKQLNDRYGHPAGDHVLSTLASIVAPSLRGFDRLARIGGEEFLILLPQTTSDQALDIAERIRLLLEHASFSFQGNDLTVTASFGLATTPTGPESWSSLMDRADAALYEAKNQGRNRVIR